MHEKKEELTQITSKNFSNSYTSDTLPDALSSGDLAGEFFDPTIDTIYFEGNELGLLSCDDIKTFVSLFENTKVRRLYLGNNELGLLTKEKIGALINGFKSTLIEELYLNDNCLTGIGTDNFKLLFDCLKTTNIKMLGLSDNILRTLGLQGLFILRDGVKNSHIQILDISDNDFKECIPKEILESMLDNGAKQLGMEISEFKSKIKEAGKLEAMIEVSRFNARQVELKLGEKSVKPPHNLHPTTLEKISDKLNDTVDSVKDFFGSFYSLYKIKKIVNDPHRYKEKHQLVIEPTIQDLKKNLATNRLRHGGVYPLKDLCIYTINSRDVPWKEAALPIELKEELENNPCGLEI